MALSRGVGLNVRDLSALSLDDLERVVSSSDFYRIGDEERRAVEDEVSRRYAGMVKGREGGEIGADALARGAGQTVDNMASGLAMLFPKATRDAALEGFGERARSREVAHPRYVREGVLGKTDGAFSSVDNFLTFAGESAAEQLPNLAAMLVPAGAVGKGLSVAGAGAKAAAAWSKLAGVAGALAMNTGENAQSLYDATGESKPLGALAAGAGYTALDTLFGIEGQMLRRMVRKPAAEVSKDVVIASLKDAVKTGGKEILGEAWTEPAQSQIVGRLTEAYYTKAFARPGEDWVSILDETLTEALGAALGSAGPAAVGAVSDYRRARADNDAVAGAMARGREQAALRRELSSGEPEAEQPVPGADRIQAFLDKRDADLAEEMGAGKERSALRRELANAREARRQAEKLVKQEESALDRLMRLNIAPAPRATSGEDMSLMQRLAESETERAERYRALDVPQGVQTASEELRGMEDMGESERARAALYEALGAKPEPASAPAKPEVVPVRAIDGDLVYVEKAQLADDGKTLLRMYDRDGNRVQPKTRGDATVINRRNIVGHVKADPASADELERSLYKDQATYQALEAQGYALPPSQPRDKSHERKASVSAWERGLRPYTLDESGAVVPAWSRAENGTTMNVPEVGVIWARPSKEKRSAHLSEKLLPKADTRSAPERAGSAVADVEKAAASFAGPSVFPKPGIGQVADKKVGEIAAGIDTGAEPAEVAAELKRRFDARDEARKTQAAASVEPSPVAAAEAPAAQSEAAFKPGDRVTHPKYGEGEVKSSRRYVKDGSRKATVKFRTAVQIVPEGELSRPGDAVKEDGGGAEPAAEAGRATVEGSAADIEERRRGIEVAEKTVKGIEARLSKERSPAGRMILENRAAKARADLERARGELREMERRPADGVAAAVQVEREPDGDAVVSVPAADKPGVSPREQRRYLLQEVEKAVADVPDYEGEQAAKVDLYEKALRSFDAVTSANKKFGGLFDSVARAAGDMERAGIGKVSIEVPGDGVFTVWRTRLALTRFGRKMEKKFPVSSAKFAWPSKSVPVVPAPRAAKRGASIKGVTPELAKEFEPFVADSADESRAYLHKPGWNAEAGEAVSSNGRAMAVVIGEPGGTSDTGRLMESYVQIVPGYRPGALPSPGVNPFESDAAPLMRKIRQARAATDKAAPIYLFADRTGALEVGLIDEDGNAYSSLDGRPGLRLALIDAEVLEDTVKFMLARGNAGVRVYVRNEISPIVVSGDGEYVVIMPLRVEGREPSDTDKDREWLTWKNEQSGRDDFGEMLDESDRKLRERVADERRAREEYERRKGLALEAMKKSPLYQGVVDRLVKMGGEVPQDGNVLGVERVLMNNVSATTGLRAAQDELAKELGVFGDGFPYSLGLFGAGESVPVQEVLDGRVPAADVSEKSDVVEADQRPEEKAGAVAEIENPGRGGDTVEDAGEELKANRRNRVSRRTWDDVKDLNPALKAREAVKTNVWPRPDYEAMIADGMEPVIAYTVKAVYDSVSAKPVTSRIPEDADFKRYVDGVNRVAEGVVAWTKDRDALAAWGAAIARKAAVMSRASSGARVSLSELSDKKGPTLLDKVYPGGWRTFRDEILVAGGNKLLRALQPSVDDAVKAMKAIDGGWPKAREAWQVRGYEVRGEMQPKVTASTGGIAATVTIGGRIAKYFETTEKAREFVAAMKPFGLFKRGRFIDSFESEAEAVAAAKKAAGVGRQGGRVDDGGTSVDAAEREGPARRMEGEDVDAKRLVADFGLRGVNFGNWMKTPAAKREAQLHLNHAYDSLHDLAEILGVPPKALSLNGMLGLAIGAQGSGRYAAHFVPGVNEINLTRTGGAGSLAHEWAHAMDHYFAVQAGLASDSEPFLTEHTARGLVKDATIRAEIVEAFRKVVAVMRRRALTPEEAAASAEQSMRRDKEQLAAWLKSVGRNFNDKDAFERLSDRIKAGDLGDGKIAASSRVYLSPVLVELRELYKKQTGRLFDLDDANSVQAWADAVKNGEARKEQKIAHIAQQGVTTDYALDASRLDRDKGGKQYWSTSLEMFARAFDAWVSDRLRDKAAKNTYLSHAGRDGETVPRNGDRVAINEAFTALVDAVETRETDKGVEMYSVAREADEAEEGGESRADVEAVAKAMGVALVWGDRAEMQGIDGMVKDGNVVLNPDADRGALLRFTFGHEVAHLMEGSAGWVAFLSRLERLSGRDAVDKYLADLNKRRAKIGLAPLTKKAALREIAADLVGSRMADARFWSRVKNMDAPLWRKVVDWVKGWFSKAAPALPFDAKALFDSPAAFAEAMKAAEQAFLGGGKIESSFTTLYRVRVKPSHRKTLPDWIVSEQRDNGHEDASERWFVADPSLLAFYKNDYGDDGEVVKVSIKTGDLEKYRVSNQIKVGSVDPKKYSRDPDNEYFLPKELAKSATVDANDGSISSNGDYSVSREDGEESATSALGRLFKGYKAARASEPESGDLSPLAVLFGQMAWYSEKIPALKRLFDRAQKARDDRHEIASRYFGVQGEGKSDLNDFMAFMRGGFMGKQASEEGRRLNEYLVRVDRDRDGAWIEQDEKTGKWTVAARNDMGRPETIFSSDDEQAALDAMHDWEAERLMLLGFSVEAAKALRAFRNIHDREYSDLVQAYRDHEAELAEIGVKPDDEWKDLFAQLRKIGNLRGTYYPRLREKSGRFILTYEHDGLRYLERFDTVTGRMARESKVRADGAQNVKKGMTETPSEDAFDGLQMVALNDFLKGALNAVERVEGRMDWEAIGLKAKYYDYTRKDGGKERHLVIRSADGGEAGKVFSAWFKDAGGHFYETKQTGEGKAWHFVDPTPKDAKRLFATSAKLFYGRSMPAQVFGKLLVGQVARMIEGRGASARKIARNDATGDDVWRGYDEDAVRVTVRNASAVAGSRSKGALAKDMLKIMSGTDVSWEAFRAKNKEMPNAEAWEAYEREVESRRVDSAKQPVAFKEAKSFISEMLRNESGAERVAGWFSGMAALWRLSGFGAAAVNLTSLATTVPAAAHTYAKMPFAETLKRLAVASTDYVRWAMADRAGEKSGLDADSQWLFDEIKRRGWEDAVFVEDAASALRDTAAEVVNTLGRGAMYAFGATERLNRASTVAAVYRSLAAREKDLTEKRKGELLDEAKSVSDKAHGVYGKVNRPAWTRGDSAGALVMRSGYVFKTYAHNLMNLMVDSGLKKRDAKAALWLAASPAVFGLAASPVAAAAYVVAQALRGLGAEVPDDPHETVFAWLREALGDEAERFARSGVPGLFGLDFSGSLSMIPDENMLERPAWELAGAPAGVLADWMAAAAQAASGNVYGAAERAAPRVLSAKLKAYREWKDGVSTRKGAPVYFGEERVKADVWDAFVRAGGLNPSAISEKRNRQWADMKAADRLGELKKEVYDGFKTWKRDGGVDRAEASRLLLRAAEYNTLAKRYAQNPNVTPITPRSLRQVIGAADRAPAAERRRVRDTRDFDGFARMGSYEDFESYMRRAGRSSGFGRVPASRIGGGLKGLSGLSGLKGLSGL